MYRCGGDSLWGHSRGRPANAEHESGESDSLLGLAVFSVQAPPCAYLAAVSYTHVDPVTLHTCMYEPL